MENESANNIPSPTLTPPKTTTPDDLLEMYEAEAKEEKVQVDKEAEKQAKIQEEVPKKILANKIAKSLKNGDSSESPIPEGTQNEENKEGEGETPKTLLTLGKKVIRAKLGEEELDLPEEALITKTLDNSKDVTFKVSDAVKAYTEQANFNRMMDKRMNHVSHREKSLETEVTGLKGKIGKVVEAVRQGDFFQATKALAKVGAIDSELDSIELERVLLDNLEKLNQTYAGLSKEQKELFWAKRKAEELDRQTKSLRDQARWNQELSSLARRKESLKEQHGLSEEDFVSSLEFLAEYAVGDGKRFRSKDDIGPEDVINYHLHLSHVMKVDEALRKLGDDIVENKQFFDHVLRHTALEPDLTAEDIEQIAREVLQSSSSETVENLNRKVQVSNSQRLNSQIKQVTSPQQQKEEIDPVLYEEWFGRRNVVRR